MAGIAKRDSPTNVAELTVTRVLQQKSTDRFKWSVNNEDKYFLLGTECESDNLFMLSTTMVSARYFYNLWDENVGGESESKKFWQIKFRAYGLEMSSDPFLLSDNPDDSSGLTFIGDRTTARIRANGTQFFNYLKDTTIKFEVIRYLLSDANKLYQPKVIGYCETSLAELASPTTSEHKALMHVLYEYEAPSKYSAIPDTEKPEVRIGFCLGAVKNYFSPELSSGTGTENSQGFSNSAQTSQQLSGPSTELGLSNSKEQQRNILPQTGTYEVAILLKSFWFRLREPMRNKIVLSFVHHPLEIFDPPVERFGKPKGSISYLFTTSQQFFEILLDPYKKIIAGRQFSESLLKDPLKVYFSKINSAGERGPAFAYAMIPLGRIFSENKDDRHSCFKSAVEIWNNTRDNNYGKLYFEITLYRGTDSALDISRESVEFLASMYAEKTESEKQG